LKNNFFVFFSVIFSFFYTKATEIKTYKTEEISKKDFSSVFFVQNDSLLKSNYEKVVNLYKNEDYVRALEKAFIFLNLCKSKNDKFWYQKILFLIAEIYDKTNKFEDSLEYYKRSLDLIKFSEEYNKYISFYDSKYGVVFLKIGSLYQKLSISNEKYNKLHFIDSAKYYYEKIENLPTLNNDIESIKAKAFNNLSGIYERDSLFDKAEEYIEKAIEIHKKYNNNLGIAFAKNNLGNIFLSQRKYSKSKEFYLEGINLIKNDNSIKATRLKASIYANLAWAMRNLKDYKAYDIQEMSYIVLDTIREKEFRGIVEGMTQEYDFESKKALFQKQEEVKLLKVKDRFSTFVVVGVLILFFLLLIITYYVLRQKNLQLKLAKTELLQSQNLDKLRSESQVRILNATIDGKESERKEIAETLHDSVSALLSSANLHLQASRKQFEGKTPIEIDKSQTIINEASEKIRNLSHSLMSSVLLKFGLNFATKDIAEKFSNSELSIDTQIGILRRYDQNFEIKTYNIIQELVNNILKHSKATNALIKLRELEGSILFEISDDGIGFDRKKFTGKEGIGLNQIEARVQVMEGQFKIITSKDNGTQIKVELPIQEREILSSFS
jgi:signal transduction histidine kinase